MNDRLLGQQQHESRTAAANTYPTTQPVADNVISRLAAIEEQLTVCHQIVARIECGIAGPTPSGESGAKPDPMMLGVNGLTHSVRDSVAMLRQRLEVTRHRSAKLDDVTLHAGMIGDPDARMPGELPATPATGVAMRLGHEIVRMLGRNLHADDFAEVIERGTWQLLAAERLRCARAICEDCRRGEPQIDGQHLRARDHGAFTDRVPCFAAAIWALGA